MNVDIRVIPHNEQRYETRTCRKCEQTKPLEDFYKHPTGKDGRLARCKVCVQAYEKMRINSWYRDKHIQVQSAYNRRQREKLLSRYGGVCACCGESRYEFLHIDHVNGGGNKHRQIAGRKIEGVLRRLGYPDGYRVLCANCNLALGHYGYCPHVVHVVNVLQEALA